MPDFADITLARKQWTKCADAEEAQRTRIVAAKKFRALDQWPAAIKLAREGAGSLTGQSPQPARPCLVVDRLSQPVRQVSNTIKNSDFGFDVLPSGMWADTETAGIFKGYLRRVQNQARGESPIEWAADGAIEGGIGWFRLRQDFVHQSWDGPLTEDVFDQELLLERLTNNLSVYCDPSAMSPTRRDAKFMFVTDDMDRDEFTDTYEGECVSGLDEFMASGDMQGWVSNDAVRIAEWWRVTYTDRPLWWLTDGTIAEQAPEDRKRVRMHRVMRTPVVKGCKINACGVLKKKGGETEEWTWPGCRIPLFPVLGEELNIDGKVVLRGIIEMGMDAQRMVNYTYSAGVEIFALNGRKAPIVSAASIANYAKVWDARTTTSFSYWPWDPFDDQGRPQPPPFFDQTEPPIQAAVALMQTSEEAIKASTSTGDASLGNSNPNERSGKALNALQAQSDLANSNYPDNVKRALIEAAQEAVYVIPKITRPGQILHILGMDDEPQQVIVGQPFVPGASKGAPPTPAPEGVTPEIAKLQSSLYKFYDLNEGTYSVTVTVGKASATKREEGAMALGDLIPHLPPEMQMKVMPDYIKQLSFPGAQAIAEKLEPPSQDQSLPPQVQQQMAQMQQQLQQASEMIKTDQVKAQATIQAATVKAQADIQMAQFEAQKEIRLQEMKDATSIAVARISAAKEALNVAAEAQEERLSTGIELAHEAQQNALDRAHQAGMSAMGSTAADAGATADRAHQQQMAASGQQHESAEADAARTAQGAEADAGRAHWYS